MKRHAEIAGAGFAGLTAAAALAQRGWSVRVHERGDRLRTTRAGIFLDVNGLRVFEAVGAYDHAVKGAHVGFQRQTRDDRNRTISSMHLKGGRGNRVFSVVRQRCIDALAHAARSAGAEIVTSSEAVAARPEGELELINGKTLKADLVIGADGVNSRIRDSLSLVAVHKRLADGCIRLLIDRTAEERQTEEGRRYIEYWSGSRRILYAPCSDQDL